MCSPRCLEKRLQGATSATLKFFERTGKSILYVRYENGGGAIDVSALASGECWGVCERLGVEYNYERE